MYVQQTWRRQVDKQTPSNSTNPSKYKNNSTTGKAQSEQTLWQFLEKALNKKDSLDTQKYLAPWLGHYIQDKNAPLTQSLQVINNIKLTEAVNNLLASRYAKNQNELRKEWQSTALDQILRKMRKDGSNKTQTKHNLSSLYPAS